MDLLPFGHIGLDRLFSHPVALPMYTYTRKSLPREDNTYTMERQDDGTIVLRMNFAGYDKERISVTFNQDKNTLHARVDEESSQQKSDNTEKESSTQAEDAPNPTPGTSIHRHLSYEYRLNKHIKPENIHTEYRNGLLTITITPPQGQDEEVVNIDIN